jgi:DNA mismatch endonuclease (patch repair protein)
MDIFTKAKRSAVMSRIRSRGNQDTEIVLARLLRANKITGWRRHLKIRVHHPSSTIHPPSPPFLTVRPDFVFPKSRLAVFVDGCFWHGCPIHGTKPKGNAAFWKKKFATNIARDRLVNRTLRRAHWRVLRIWEHELKHSARLLRRLLGAIQNQTTK